MCAVRWLDVDRHRGRARETGRDGPKITDVLGQCWRDPSLLGAHGAHAAPTAGLKNNTPEGKHSYPHTHMYAWVHFKDHPLKLETYREG